MIGGRTGLEKLKFGLELKQHEIQKLKLELGKSVYDIKASNNIMQLKINSLAADARNISICNYCSKFFY